MIQSVSMEEWGPPFFHTHGLDHFLPFQHENYHKWTESLHFGAEGRMHTVVDELNLKIGGGLDDVWQNTETKELHIVDYKSTSQKSPGFFERCFCNRQYVVLSSQCFAIHRPNHHQFLGSTRRPPYACGLQHQSANSLSTYDNFHAGTVESDPVREYGRMGAPILPYSRTGSLSTVPA